jgi:hypothetical protein
MIAHKTFTATHLVNVLGRAGLERLEKLREEAERYIADRIREEDVVAVAETRDLYASSVTVWYRRS